MHERNLTPDESRMTEELVFQRWDNRPIEPLVQAHLVEATEKQDHDELFFGSWFIAALEAPMVAINGQVYQNPRELIAGLRREPRFLAAMTPVCLTFSHGDPHPGNIHVFYEKGHPRHLQAVMFVDPNAMNLYHDPAYDWSKIAHALHGRYDFINAGLFDVDVVSLPGGMPAFNLNVPFDPGDVVASPGGSGATSRIIKKRLTGGEAGLYDHMWRAFFPILRDRIATDPRYAPFRNDSTVELRVLVYEAMHFLTMTQFHLLPSTKTAAKALAIYLTGVRLLSEAVDFFQSERVLETSSRGPE